MDGAIFKTTTYGSKCVFLKAFSLHIIVVHIDGVFQFYIVVYAKNTVIILPIIVVITNNVAPYFLRKFWNFIKILTLRSLRALLRG